jgi:hypothetical protein
MGIRVIPRVLRPLFNRQLAWALLAALALILAAAGVNLIGIRIVGDIGAWAKWLREHRLEFLAWRLCLYGATAWGWVWMRSRVRQREPDAHRRLRRVEIAAVLVIVAIEAMALLHS